MFQSPSSSCYLLLSSKSLKRHHPVVSDPRVFTTVSCPTCPLTCPSLCVYQDPRAVSQRGVAAVGELQPPRPLRRRHGPRHRLRRHRPQGKARLFPPAASAGPGGNLVFYAQSTITVISGRSSWRCDGVNEAMSVSDSQLETLVSPPPHHPTGPPPLHPLRTLQGTQWCPSSTTDVRRIVKPLRQPMAVPKTAHEVQ